MIETILYVLGMTTLGLVLKDRFKIPMPLSILPMAFFGGHLTFLRGIPLSSGHCADLDVWGWMDSEPSARTALPDSGCTA